MKNLAKGLLWTLVYVLFLLTACSNSSHSDNKVKGPVVTPDAGTTVYGIVSANGKGVPGVVVSDGVEVTTTDTNGIYQLKSAKQQGYVFISIPGGYEVPTDGVLPCFSKPLKGNTQLAERADFTLEKVEDQNSYKVFMLGDMHLANRTGDKAQFEVFAADLNHYRAQYPARKMYAITLGDMTWDLYWYSNEYALTDYLNTMNTLFKDLQIFHTIGNHDNDYKSSSDLSAEIPYRTHIAPTYYSFNIGKVHYVVLDNIDCDQYDGTKTRKYKKYISAQQLDWLAKDMAHVSKSTPVVIAMHAQVFYPQLEGGFKIDHDEADIHRLFSILDGYQTHFVTGHTHLNFNVTPDDAVTEGRNFYEHNTAAVCASWWWSGHLTPGVHVSLDGTPGGYAVWDVSDTSLQWMYKATGYPESYQFRTYDLNQVSFSLKDVPDMPADIDESVKEKYMTYVNAYPGTSNNEVLINIWNWNPRWTLTVTDEHGAELTTEAVSAYDPLHIAALTVKRFNSPSLKSAPGFTTKEFVHFFKVKAADADTDLHITVRDEFGHVWEEYMARPKAFSIDAYKLQ